MCGSDHYPITIHFGDRDASHANASWKLCKADWVSFADRGSEQLGSGNPNISIDEFTEKLISIASDTIPKSKHLFLNIIKSGLMIHTKVPSRIERQPSEK